jgi:hypothetical protein
MKTCRNGISAARLASTGYVTGRRCPLRLPAAASGVSYRHTCIVRIDGTLLSGVGLPLPIELERRPVFKD